jgi:hypothetical protein
MVVQFLMWAVRVLICLVGALAAYALLTAGSTDSLLRRVFPDPSADVYVAAGASLTVFILGFFVFFARDQDHLSRFVAANAEKISGLRDQGLSDDQIADQMLAAAGSRGGYRHRLARRKLIVALAAFEPDGG